MINTFSPSHIAKSVRHLPYEVEPFNQAVSFWNLPEDYHCCQNGIASELRWQNSLNIIQQLKETTVISLIPASGKFMLS